jgi:hypothetical protein
LGAKDGMPELFLWFLALVGISALADNGWRPTQFLDEFGAVDNKVSSRFGSVTSWPDQRDSYKK